MTSRMSALYAMGRSWTPAQRFAVVFGAAYLLTGIAGFAVTGVHDFTGMDHEKLLIFAVNPLHNCLHLLVALVWLVCVARRRTARAANLALGVVLGLVTVVGLTGGMGMLGMSGLADPDNLLHLASATLSLYFGSLGAESAQAPLAATAKDGERLA